MLCEQVVAHGADIGIALDGDADRLIIADEHGRKVDGDQLMALIAVRLARDGRLRGGGVVATVMSNLGLERYLKSLGLDLVRTPGRRPLRRRAYARSIGFNVGGEQSGHIILTDYVTTGDGLIAALQVLAVRRRDAAAGQRGLPRLHPVPQLLRNVRFNGGAPLEDGAVKAAIARREAALGATGRLLIRKSGTEPVIRVMAEGDDRRWSARVVNTLIGAIQRAARKLSAGGQTAGAGARSSPARIPAAAPASRPTSRRSPRSAATPMTAITALTAQNTDRRFGRASASSRLHRASRSTACSTTSAPTRSRPACCTTPR